MPNRQLNTVEKNHLLKFGIDPSDIAQYGEMPVEYITGKALFQGREFAVTPDTLIPRVETEELVTLIQQDMLSDESLRGKLLIAADIGTGSGVIGISMALFLEQQQRSFELILADISSAALEVARENAQRLLPQSQYGKLTFLLSDLLAGFPPQRPLDLIFANVPYIPRERILTLDASVKDFEPLIALDGGEDGLQYVFLLLEQAASRLQPGGKLYLELDHTHTAEKFSRFHDRYTLKLSEDQFGRSRFGIFTLKAAS